MATPARKSSRPAIVALLVFAIVGGGWLASHVVSTGQDDSRFAPTGDKLTCATTGNPDNIETVFHSTTAHAAPDCLTRGKGYRWADPRAIGFILACSARGPGEVAVIYSEDGPGTYTTGLCQAMERAGYIVTYAS